LSELVIALAFICNLSILTWRAYVQCGGKGDLREIPHFPAKIPLPRALYQPADREQLMSMKQIGSHLPTGFKPIYIKSGPSSKQSGRRPGKTAAAAAKVVGKRDIRGVAVPVTNSVPHESVQVRERERVQL
jgi:hypothetical protein